jgi:pro-sigmaK processing inhibitor BofA
MGEAFMLKKFIYFVKKVVFSFFLLYGFNLFVNSLNIVIPINIFTIGTISVLGVPGLMSLIAMFFIVR